MRGYPRSITATSSGAARLDCRQTRGPVPSILGKLLAALTFAAVLVPNAICAAANDKSIDEAWRNVFDAPQTLATLDRPVVVFLYIQHAAIVRKGLGESLDSAKPHHAAEMRTRFAELSGLDCLVVHESELRGTELNQPQIKALLISGRSTTDIPPDDEKFYEFLRTTRIPMIGFCGGCQLIGKAYGIPVVYMRELAPGEPDPMPNYHPGRFKERGYLTIQIGLPDPLLAGLPAKPLFRQTHAFQLADVPPGFDLLASSTECRVQAIKDRQRMVYGVQFHPEAYDDEHPDGRIVLANFFRLALGK